MGQAALVVRQDQDEERFLSYLRDLSEDAANSRLFNGITREQATCLMLAGRDFGLSAMQSLRMFDLIQGRPVLKSDALVGICKSHPSCEHFYRVSDSPTEATWTTKRKGEPEQTSTFTIEDAKAAQLLGKKDSNWEKYPKRMLNARAKAFLARDVYPDLVAGLLSSEEMADIKGVDLDVRDLREPYVREVPQPRPSPTPDSGTRAVVDTILADAQGLLDEMRAAMSLADLAAAAAKVKGFGFPDEVRAGLAAEHKIQKARVTPPPDAGDSWEPARG